MSSFDNPFMFPGEDEKLARAMFCLIAVSLGLGLIILFTGSCESRTYVTSGCLCDSTHTKHEWTGKGVIPGLVMIVCYPIVGALAVRFCEGLKWLIHTNGYVAPSKTQRVYLASIWPIVLVFTVIEFMYYIATRLLDSLF